MAGSSRKAGYYIRFLKLTDAGSGRVGRLNIPWRELSEDALNGVIQEFVTREGTEYGGREVSLSDKCRQVRRQLERGEAMITYDQATGTCSIIPTS